MLPIPSVSPKDGKSRKATYYDHIHTLFSLYQLSEAETDIMRNLALSPLAGVQNRLFANWLKLRDMNTVNALIEKGGSTGGIGFIIQADADCTLSDSSDLK